MRHLIIFIFLFSAFLASYGQSSWKLSQSLPAVAKYDNSGDYFGYKLAVYGSYAAIAAPKTRFDTGAVYVYQYQNGNWVNVAKLIPSTPSTNDKFGYSIAMDDNTIIVGAPGYDNGKGRVYLFEMPATGWTGTLTESAVLTPSTVLSGGENFGFSVAIWNDTIVVGAPYVNYQTNTYAGLAYVYLQPTGGWTGTLTENAILSTTVTQSYMYFGYSVDIHHNIIVCGAPGYNEIAGQYDHGKVFIYEIGTLQSMTQTANLQLASPQENYELGKAVAVWKADTTYIYANAPKANFDEGYIYVFAEPNQNLKDTTEVAYLRSFDANWYDNFGQRLDVWDKYVFASNFYRNYVSLFIRPDTGWKNITNPYYEIHYLKDSTSGANDYFGFGLAIYDTMAFVGAYNNSNSSGINAGAAYYFSSSNWATAKATLAPKQKVLPTDPYWHTASNQHGKSVAMDSIYAVVGASTVNAAYVYKLVNGQWQKIATLSPSNPQADADFGYSVAIDKNYIIVGAPNYDGAFTNEGRAYIFAKPTTGDWQDATETAMFAPSDPEAELNFGYDVDIDNVTNIAAVGAPNSDFFGYADRGAIYLFQKPVGEWTDTTETCKLYHSLPDDYDRLGISVAIYRDIVVAGAPYDEPKTGGGISDGYVYIFKKPDQGWKDTFQVATLHTGNPDSTRYFGYDVDIEDSIIVVGCPNCDLPGDLEAGAVFIFTEPPYGWGSIDTMTHTAKFYSSDHNDSYYFGKSLDLTDTLLIVGATGVDSIADIDAGRAYIFHLKPQNGWANRTEDFQIYADDYASNDQFGTAVAIWGDYAFVGVPYKELTYSDEGKVYVFNYTVRQVTAEPKVVDPSASLSVDIYPNPASSTLTISSSHTLKSLSILTIDGRKVKSLLPASKQISLNVADLQSGIYLLKLETSDGTLTKKIIVNH